MKVKNIEVPTSQIKKICEKYHINKFALFGSVLRNLEVTKSIFLPLNN